MSMCMDSTQPTEGRDAFAAMMAPNSASMSPASTRNTASRQGASGVAQQQPAARVTPDEQEEHDPYYFTRDKDWLGVTAECIKRNYPNETYCRPAKHRDSKIWQYGMLIGDDPDKATHWRCMCNTGA